MMQYLYGDVTACLQSLDTQYVMGLEYKQFRAIIQDYVVTIPLNHGNMTYLESATTNNRNQHIQRLVKGAIFICHPHLPIDKYQVSFKNDQIKVTLARKGDKIELIRFFYHVLNDFEYGTNLRTGLNICFPNAVAADYVTIR